MNPDGYSAFAAWCVMQGVEPVSRDEYVAWPTRRLQRHMNKILKNKGKTPASRGVTLF